MQLVTTNNINFSSRNATIRLADDIARKVNNEFPRLSASRIDDFKHIKEYKQLRKGLWKKIILMRQEIEKNFSSNSDLLEKIDSILIPIKQLKVGNCSESTYLSAIIAKINGIRNCYPATIKSPRGDNFDHRVLFVADKKPYIIDAWLGFADYLPQAIMRYSKDFRANFNFEKFKTEKMRFLKYETIFYDFMKQDFSSNEVTEILKKYPELKIKKTKIT